MPDQDYSLRPLATSFARSRLIIICITLGAMALALAAYLLRPARYMASVEFFLKNPMYADRGYVYNNDARIIDYFASDEEIDRLKSLVWADSVQQQIIEEFHLDKAYHQSLDKPAQAKALMKEFSERVKIYRTESKVVVLSYSDKDEARAAGIASRCVALLEQQLRGYYNEMRHGIWASILVKIQQEDSTIAALTDTLSTLREQYGIYDIISPARYNIMLSELKNNGKPGFARGVELVQNVEAEKDQLVSDRAKQISLAGQYATGTGANELPVTRIIKTELPPFKREGPGLLTVLLGAGLAGFFFSLIYVLAAQRLRHSSTAARL